MICAPHIAKGSFDSDEILNKSHRKSNFPLAVMNFLGIVVENIGKKKWVTFQNQQQDKTKISLQQNICISSVTTCKW